MTPSPYTEDTLVQQTTADYLEHQLGWETTYAHNHEDFGPQSLLGRTSEREVVLARPLRERLAALNPGLPDEAYDDGVRRITATAVSQTIVAANHEKYDLLRDGVQVTYRDDKGRPTRRRLRVLDFDHPEDNHFLCVREMWVRGDLYRRRPDIVGFVNGLPLLFIECKNIHRDLQAAFEKNYADYRDTVPHLFHHNAVVMFGNGEKARIIKEGMDLPAEMRAKQRFRNLQRMAVDDAFKEQEHPFRIAVVCAMWLTGFDVPSLSTLYLDKPLKAHTLMQAIARANRVNEGKNNGLIVDYCGVLKHLRKALATFAGTRSGGQGGAGGEIDPARPHEELLADLAEAIALVRSFLHDGGAPLADVIRKEGFARNAAIVACKEVANDNDETRKRFEVLCREVFKKFRACVNVRGVNAHRADRDAIDVVYRSLQRDREQADIRDIIRVLHEVVDAAIDVRVDRTGEDRPTYDISAIDFDRLKREFERSRSQRTAVQALKHTVEERLRRLLARNPLRTDFQQHYERIVAEYNREKERVTIERTFEELLKFFAELEEEESRALREGLDEESLAIFDLLKKSDLDKADIRRIKSVSKELLQTLKAEKLRVDQWREKEATQSAVKVAIHDFLYSDETGLPTGTYSEAEVSAMSETVFAHVYRAYPTVPSPFYDDVTAA